ncbi:unnamed protein product [Onchocerca ochengi]|uniref:GLOBIN domain-containing protein n=2 Tax=Onchocerca TaxID=6281 RepID=A0A182DXX9_ONCOC|nr:unnamed protein product [Onchocerca ochengi]
MCIRIFRTIRDGLFSLFVSSSLQDAEALTKEEKKMLVKTWPNLKEKTPNMFLRAWIKSAQMSVNIRKATGLREDEEPETNEKFLSLSPFLENFVDKLIIEFRCNDDKISQFRKFSVAEACRKLGARHVLIENFHMNFWDIFLGNLIQIIIDTHSERNQQEIAVVCEKFCSFFVNFMRDGYKKRLQEEISGRRRMNVG